MAFVTGDPLVSAAITAQTAAFAVPFAAMATSQATIAAAAAAEQAGDVVAIGVEIAQIAVHGALMVAQYQLGQDAIDDRDDAIDDQINFMQQLQDLKVSQDLPMLLRKKDVLTDLIIPTIDFCQVDFGLFFHSNNDGLAVDNKSDQLSRSSRGVPSGWLLHEGVLKGMKSAGYTQGIDKNADKRRVEALRKSKSRLVRSAQSTLKSEYNSAEILNKKSQVATIHGGIADLYMQGFNSSGAALGVALGRLSNKNESQTVV